MNLKTKRTIQNYIPIIASALTALFFGGKAKDRIYPEKTPVVISRDYSNKDDETYQVWKNAVDNISEDEFKSYWKKLCKPQIRDDMLVGDNLKQGNLESRLVSNKSFNQKRLYLGRYVGQTLIKRFNEFEDYFVAYAQETPKEMSPEEFMALMVSISQKESSIGYPNGGKKRSDKMLMGYGSPDRSEFFGARKQIKSASKTLRGAYNKENSLYRASYNSDGMEKTRYILSIYNKGKINKAGLRYADEVLANYEKWVKEFGDKL